MSHSDDENVLSLQELLSPAKQEERLLAKFAGGVAAAEEEAACVLEIPDAEAELMDRFERGVEAAEREGFTAIGTRVEPRSATPNEKFDYYFRRSADGGPAFTKAAMTNYATHQPRLAKYLWVNLRKHGEREMCDESVWQEVLRLRAERGE